MTIIFRYVKNMSAGEVQRKPDVREEQPQRKAQQMERESGMVGGK